MTGSTASSGRPSSDAFDWAELDLIELSRVLIEVGRKVAPIPLAAHAACITFLSGAGQATDRALYAAAVAEERDHLPVSPTVTADAGGALTGTKTLVRAGMAADALLVTATGPEGAGVYLVDAATVERGRSAPAMAMSPRWSPSTAPRPPASATRLRSSASVNC